MRPVRGLRYRKIVARLVDMHNSADLERQRLADQPRRISLAELALLPDVTARTACSRAVIGGVAAGVVPGFVIGWTAGSLFDVSTVVDEAGVAWQVGSDGRRMVKRLARAAA